MIGGHSKYNGICVGLGAEGVVSGSEAERVGALSSTMTTVPNCVGGVGGVVGGKSPVSFADVAHKDQQVMML